VVGRVIEEEENWGGADQIPRGGYTSKKPKMDRGSSNLKQNVIEGSSGSLRRAKKKPGRSKWTAPGMRKIQGEEKVGLQRPSCSCTVAFGIGVGGGPHAGTLLEKGGV